MSKLFHKVCIYLTAFAACLTLLSAMPALASGNSGTIDIPETEVLVDQDSGEFHFTLQIDAQENYAGAEFGIICSRGAEITGVTSTAGSVTGPQKANGLVWFGFFDGEDSFQGTTTVTVKGTCETGMDCAVVVQDVSLYTIGEQEYTSTDIECGTVVNLLAGQAETAEPAEDSEDPQETPQETGDIDVLILIICLSVIAAGLVGMLIYKMYQNKKSPKGEKRCF